MTWLEMPVVAHVCAYQRCLRAGESSHEAEAVRCALSWVSSGVAAQGAQEAVAVTQRGLLSLGAQGSRENEGGAPAADAAPCAHDRLVGCDAGMI